MNFNRGYICPGCGPIEKASKKTIKKVQFDICPGCGSTVTEWERPLTDRAGRCHCCGAASFELRIHKRQLLRRCKTCDAVLNTDTGQIMREGKT